MKLLGDLEDRSSSSKEIKQQASKIIFKHSEDDTKKSLDFHFILCFVTSMLDPWLKVFGDIQI